MKSIIAAYNKIHGLLDYSLARIVYLLRHISGRHRCILCGENRLRSNFSSARYYLKCDNCDLIFTGNPPGLDDIRAFIKNLHRFGEYRQRASIDKANWQEWKRETYRRLDIPVHDTAGNCRLRVLEIGCAEGWQLEIFHSMGWETCGLEPNGYFFRECRKAALNVRKGLLETISIPSRPFDLVIATHVLEHLPEPVKALQKMNALLRDEGLLLLEVPLDFCPGHPEHLCFFSRKSLAILLQKTGFRMLNNFSYTDHIFHNRNFALAARKLGDSPPRRQMNS